MNEKETKTYDDLPIEIQEQLFKAHSHAEIENDIDPEQIVYTEKNVIAIINLILNKQ